MILEGLLKNWTQNLIWVSGPNASSANVLHNSERGVGVRAFRVAEQGASGGRHALRPAHAQDVELLPG